MKMDPTTSRYFLLLVAAVSMVMQGAKAQNDLCSCSPGTFNFTMSYGSSCEEIEPTGGILATSCVIEPLGEDQSVTDLVPVTVNSIVVVELGEDRSIISQENFYDLSDGGTIQYTSIILEDQDMIPSGIQLNMIGLNAAGESIVNIIAIQYTNNCSVFPVLEDGFSLGWTVLTALGNPPNGVCTAYDEGLPPTLAPTTGLPSPSVAPTTSTPAQTEAPTTSPTGGVPVEPTGVPTSPTASPVVSPAPTSEPGLTPSPTSAPVVTSLPTAGPTSFSMSMSMSMAMGDMYDMIDVLEEFGIQVPRAKDGRTAKKTKSDKKGSKSAKADPKASDLGTKKSSKAVRSKKSVGESDVVEPTKSSKKGDADDDAMAKQPSKEGKRRRRLRIHSVLA